MRNKLLKAVSTVMASLVFAGAFVFISPKADVRAVDDEWWDYLLDDPDDNGIRWFYLTDEDYETICGSSSYSLPDPDLFPDKVLTNGHLYIRLDSSLSVNKLLDYTDRATTPIPVTVDLNGNSITLASDGGLLNLSKSASYELVNSSESFRGVINSNNGSGYPSFKDTNGGYFNVAGGCTLTIDGVNIGSCWAGGKGGAIYAGAGSYVNISNSNITGCRSSDDGYAIYADAWSNLTLTNVCISDCEKMGSSDTGVGAFYNGSNNTVFKGKIVIRDNHYDFPEENLYIKEDCPISVNSNSSGTDVLVTYETPAAGKQLFLPASGVSLDGYVYDDNLNYILKANGQLARAASSVTLKGYNLELKADDFSKIGIKFKFHLSENLSDEGMVININGKDFYVEGWLDSDHDYEAKYYIDYLHIVDAIEISAKYAGSEEEYFVQPDTEVSVKGYAQAILEDTSGKYTDTEKTIIKGMLNYGTYMQAYFGVSGEPANSILSSAEKAEAFCSESEYQALRQVGTVPEAWDDLSFYGASFVTKKEGTLSANIYFKLVSGKTLSNISYDLVVDDIGRSLLPNSNPKFAYVPVENITAYNLDQVHEITLNGQTFTYCPLDYVYLVYNYYQNNEPLYNYVKALYAYHKIVKGAMGDV